MRKVIAVTAVAVLATAVVTAQALSSGAKLVGSVTGSGHRTTAAGEPGGMDYRTFSFTAHEYSDGSAKGQAQVNNRAQDLKQHIEIDCLRVIGNKASIGGVITKSTRPDFVGNRANFFVEDNGEGSSAQPDRISNIFRNGEGDLGGNTNCRQVFIQPVRVVEHGNIQVHDRG